MLKKIRSVFSISKHNNKSKVIDLIRIIVIFQLLIVAATIHGCFMPGMTCSGETKQYIANMMTVITTSAFAL